MTELVSLRDQVDTKREYETIFIVQPEVTPEKLQTINDRIRKIVNEQEGILITVENWGKRKLAYEIQNNFRGIYLYWRYLGGSKLVLEFERNLRMLDDVIRYQTVKIDQDVDPNARPSDMDEEKFNAASEILPDEEDSYRARSPEERAEGDDFDDDDNFASDDDDDYNYEDSDDNDSTDNDEGRENN